MKQFLFVISSLQTHCHFKLDFQNVDQHTGGTWLIHGTKHHKNSKLQSLNPPIEYPSIESKHDIKESTVTFKGNGGLMQTYFFNQNFCISNDI